MSRFVLTAQLQLRSPSSGEVRRVVTDIERGLKTVKVDVTVGGSRKATSALKKVEKATIDAANASERLGRSFAVSIKRFAAFSIATRAIGLLSRGLGGAIEEAIDFERQLIKVSQVTGKTMSELKGLTSEITRLATSLGVSSKALLGVTRVLSQAGMSARETKIALESLAKSTLAATFEDIAQTAEGAVAIFNQFGKGAKALEGQLGSINAVAGQFAVEAGDLIAVVRRAGGVFKAAGGSLNELIALFTSVRSTTREAAESIATGLRTIFTRIQRPSTIKFLKKLGVELTDVEGKFVGPYKAIKLLSEAMRTLETGDLRFIRIAEVLGGFRQIGKVIPLLQQMAVSQDALRVAMEGTNSMTEDAAKAQGTLAIKITKVKEEWLALIRSITESPTFQIMANTALQLASALIKVAETLKPIIPLMAAMAGFKLFTGLKGFAGGMRGGLTSKGAGMTAGFASGGLVPGGGNRDTVPAMLTPGEFVIKRSSTRSIGANRLQKMNKGGKYTINADQEDNLLGGFFLRREKGDEAGSLRHKFKGKDLGIKNPRVADLLTQWALSKKGDVQGPPKASASRSNSVDDASKHFVSKNSTRESQKGLGLDLGPGKGRMITDPKAISNTVPKDQLLGAYNKDLKAGKVNAIEAGIKIPKFTYKNSGAVGFMPALGVEGKKGLAKAEGDKSISAMVASKSREGLESIVEEVASKITSEKWLDIGPIDSSDGNEMFADSMKNLFVEGGAADALEGYVLEGIIAAITGAQLAGKSTTFDFPGPFSVNIRKRLAALFGDSDTIDKLSKADAKRTSSTGNWRKIGDKIANEANKASSMKKLVELGFTKPVKAAGGGPAGTDTVSALLTPGEFVVNRRSAQRIGYGNLSRMNARGSEAFASGGIVGGPRKFQGGGGAAAGAGGGQALFQGAMALSIAAPMLADAAKSIFGSSKEVNLVIDDFVKNIMAAVMMFGILMMGLNKAKERREAASKAEEDASKKSVDADTATTESIDSVSTAAESAAESLDKVSDSADTASGDAPEPGDKPPSVPDAGVSDDPGGDVIHGPSDAPPPEPEPAPDPAVTPGAPRAATPEEMAAASTPEAKAAQKELEAKKRAALKTPDWDNLAEDERRAPAVDPDPRAATGEEMRLARRAAPEEMRADDAAAAVAAAAPMAEEGGADLSKIREAERAATDIRPVFEDPTDAALAEGEAVPGVVGLGTELGRETRIQAGEEIVAESAAGSNTMNEAQEIVAKEEEVARGRRVTISEELSVAEEEVSEAKVRHSGGQRQVREGHRLQREAQEGLGVLEGRQQDRDTEATEQATRKEELRITAVGKSEEAQYLEGAGIAAEMEVVAGAGRAEDAREAEKTAMAEAEDKQAKAKGRAGTPGEGGSFDKSAQDEALKAEQELEALRKKHAANEEARASAAGDRNEAAAAARAKAETAQAEAETAGKEYTDQVETNRISTEERSTAQGADEDQADVLRDQQTSGEALAATGKQNVDGANEEQRLGKDKVRSLKQEAEVAERMENKAKRRGKNLRRRRAASESDEGSMAIGRAQLAIRERGVQEAVGGKGTAAGQQIRGGLSDVKARAKEEGHDEQKQIKRQNRYLKEYEKQLRKGKSAQEAHNRAMKKSVSVADSSWKATKKAYLSLKDFRGHIKKAGKELGKIKAGARGMMGRAKGAISGGLGKMKAGMTGGAMAGAAMAGGQMAVGFLKDQSNRQMAQAEEAGDVEGFKAQMEGNLQMGTLQGVAGGAMTGAAMGAFLGPVGMGVGAAVGAGLAFMFDDAKERKKEMDKKLQSMELTAARETTSKSIESIQKSGMSMGAQKDIEASLFKAQKTINRRGDDGSFLKNDKNREKANKGLEKTQLEVARAYGENAESLEELDAAIGPLIAGKIGEAEAVKEAAKSAYMVSQGMKALAKANMDFLKITSMFGAAQMAVDNYIMSMKTGASAFGPIVNTLKQAQKNIAMGKSGVAAVDQAQAGLVAARQRMGIDENSDVAQSMNRSMESTKKIAKFTASMPMKMGSVKFERGETDASAKDKIRAALITSDMSQDVKDVIEKNIGQLSPDQMTAMKAGKLDLSTAMASVNADLAKLGSGFLKAAEAMMKHENQISKLTQLRVNSERTLLAAQKTAIQLTMQAATIIAKHGGRVVTPEEKRQGILDKANVSSKRLGLDNLDTGGGVEIAKRGQQILAKFAQQEGMGRMSKFAGAKGTDADKRQELKQELAGLVSVTMELIKADEEALGILQKKNALEKSSLEALISGDLDKFFKQQAAVGAGAAAATGDKRLMGLFGAEAMGAGLKDLQKQKAAGVTEIGGQNIDDIIGRAAEGALAARGITDPKMASMLAGQTVEEEKIRGSIREKAGALSAIGQTMTDVASLEVKTAQITIDNAELIFKNELKSAATNLQGPAAGDQVASRHQTQPEAMPVAAIEGGRSSKKPRTFGDLWRAGTGGTQTASHGGMIYADRGIFVPRGTDTVPAMLTPGEFVVRKDAVNRGNNLQTLRAMNTGNASQMSSGGSVQYLQEGTSGDNAIKGLSDLSKALNTFNATFEKNIKSLKDMKFNIKLDTTNVKIDLTGAGFMKTMQENIRVELLRDLGQRLANAKQKPDGTFDFNNQGVVT